MALEGNVPCVPGIDIEVDTSTGSRAVDKLLSSLCQMLMIVLLSRRNLTTCARGMGWIPDINRHESFCDWKRRCKIKRTLVFPVKYSF